MSKLSNQKESDGLKQTSAAVSYVLRNVKYNFVLSCIDKNMSPQQITKWLTEINLVNANAKSESIEKYIQYNMSMKWDEKNNSWFKTNQIDTLDQIDKMCEEFTWEKIPVRLSENDSKTVLRDFKQIVKDLKNATSDLAKIAKNIDKFTVLINPEIHEITDKEVEA